MKATDLFKHNSKQNTYKLAELEKYIFTDKTPFDTQVRPVGTVLGELLGNREKYVRRPWNETKSYINSYTISIDRLTAFLFPIIGAGAGADARARARAATPRPPPPGDGDGNDNNDNDDNDDDQPITRRNFLLLRDATAASAATTQAALAALAAQIAQFPRAPSHSLGSGEGAGAAAAASRAASRPGSAAAASSSATETARPRSQKRGTPANDSSPTILPISASAAAAALGKEILRPQAMMREEDKEDEEDEEGTDPDRKKARLSLKDININGLNDIQVRNLAGQLKLNGSGGGGGPGPSIDELKRRLIQYKKNQSGGARENWDELSGLEITDLMKMNENPNKFLKEKVYEFYGETKDEMYMFSLMNSIYHYLDYVNEITVDRDILDIIKDNYDKLNTLPLETLPFDDFKGGYSEIKQQKINQYKIVPISSVNIRRRLFITRKILNKAKQEKAAKTAAEAVAAATAAVAAAVSPQGEQPAAAAAAAATALVTRMDDEAGETVSDSGSVPQQQRSSPAFGSPGHRRPAAARVAAAPVKAGEETQINKVPEEVEAPGPLTRGISMFGTERSRKYRKTRKLRKGNV